MSTEITLEELQSEKEIFPANAEKLNLETYTSLEQLGLVMGEETIESIANALPNGSMLEVAITSANNKNIYPASRGLMTVSRSENLVVFKFIESPTFAQHDGIYDISNKSWSYWFDAPTKTYIEQLIQTITEVGVPKLNLNSLPLITATEDGQTEFEIPSSANYDSKTDTVWVQKSMLLLNSNGDYTISDNKVILTRGVPVGTTIGIHIWKNVPMGDEGSVSGNVIAKGTLPLDRLEELPEVNVTSDIPLHLSINENGGLRITYDDGSDE